MAPSLSLDDWARICQHPRMASAVDLHGPESIFTINVAITIIRQEGLAWLYALGITKPFHLTGGTGRLDVTAHEINFDPVITAQPAPPRLATQDTIAARLALCHPCPRWNGTHCTLAGCNCTGAAHVARALARCPLNRWQPIVLDQ